MDTLPRDVLIEVGSELKQIEWSYKDLDEPELCGFASCRTSHKNGFVVTFICEGEERLGIVGHVCGKRYFGDGWVEQERRYQQRVNEAAIRERLEAYLPAASEIMALLRTSLSRLQWQMHVRHELEQHISAAFSDVVNALRTNNGYLAMAQGRRRTTVKLRGERFFLRDGPYESARDLLEEINRFRLFIASPQATLRETERRLGVIGDVSRRWKMISDWIMDADAAITPEFIRLMILHQDASSWCAARVSEDGTQLLVEIAAFPGLKSIWEPQIALNGPTKRFHEQLMTPKTLARITNRRM